MQGPGGLDVGPPLKQRGPAGQRRHADFFWGCEQAEPGDADLSPAEWRASWGSAVMQTGLQRRRGGRWTVQGGAGRTTRLRDPHSQRNLRSQAHIRTRGQHQAVHSDVRSCPRGPRPSCARPDLNCPPYGRGPGRSCPLTLSAWSPGRAHARLHYPVLGRMNAHQTTCFL